MSRQTWASGELVRFNMNPGAKGIEETWAVM